MEPPRIANRLLKLRDFGSQIMGNGAIDIWVTDKALTMLDTTKEKVWSHVDQNPSTMIEMYGGGPVSLEPFLLT